MWHCVNNVSTAFFFLFVLFLSEFQVEYTDTNAHLSPWQLHKFCISWLPFQTGFIDKYFTVSKEYTVQSLACARSDAVTLGRCIWKVSVGLLRFFLHRLVPRMTLRQRMSFRNKMNPDNRLIWFPAPLFFKGKKTNKQKKKAHRKKLILISLELCVYSVFNHPCFQ